jgi:hypothetical protein
VHTPVRQRPKERSDGSGGSLAAPVARGNEGRREEESSAFAIAGEEVGGFGEGLGFHARGTARERAPGSKRRRREWKRRGGGGGAISLENKRWGDALSAPVLLDSAHHNFTHSGD